MSGRDYNRVYMPAEYWQSWAYLAPDEMYFWNGGDITLWSNSGNTELGRFFGVRFDPSDFSEFVTETVDRPAEASSPTLNVGVHPPEKNRGGAPRKVWWDDLWIEVIRQIESGKLRKGFKTSAAKLEIHLLETAEAMGFSPGDSTLKPMSLKLFKYIEENGGK